jgi:hypothetical protein
VRLHRSGFAVSSIMLFAVALGGCKSKEAGAREAFAKNITCPEDRVEVRSRPEVKPSMLVTMPEPPAAVKADPARLKMWQDEQHKSATSSDDTCEMFEARGCAQQTLLCCFRPPKRMDRVICSTRPYANGVAKW